jgi:hypothetical protein
MQLSSNAFKLASAFEHRRADVIAHERGAPFGDFEDKILSSGPPKEPGDISEPD